MTESAPILLAQGRYEVGALIGRGGMAEVHVGHDNRLGRTVAIKILRSDLARDPSFQARFRREAQAAAALNHPAIVAVYDTGEDAITDPATGAVRQVPYIVMEYVEGRTVRDILKNGNAVPIEEAIDITEGVLSALEYSHNAGIVHRDIKPANVMITPSGAVKVMDFGIARALADSSATMTQTQAVIGTAQYLSPEQARGETVDARSDLYSTGCLLFELLTGRPPFIGDSPVAVAYQHVREEPPVPSSIASDVPASLDRIVRKALAKDRNDRYHTAAEFRADLEAARTGGPVLAPPATAATQVLAAPVTPATQVIGAAATAPAPVWQPVAQAALGADTATQPVVDDDGEPERRSHLGLFITLGTIAVVAIGVLLAILFLGGNNDDGDQPAESFVVPVVANLTIDEAKAALVRAGLTSDPVVQEQASDTIDKDVVISSNPPAGDRMAPADTITLVVSSGPDSITIPEDLAYSQPDQAELRLKALGLEVSSSREPEDSADVPEGQVTRTDPAGGTVVEPGSTVKIFISSGKVTVPDLKNLSWTDAQAKLAEVGLTPERFEEQDDSIPAETVLAQSPLAGLKVDQSSVVQVTVAVAVAEVSVPDLARYTEADARAALMSNGLTVGALSQEASATVPAGSVISTTPAAGTSVKAGSAVGLVISTGPEPTPTPSTSTTSPAPTG